MADKLHPLTKLFTTGDQHYLYDGKTNRIIRIPPAVYHALQSMDNGTLTLDAAFSALRDRFLEDDLHTGQDLVQQLDTMLGLLTPTGLKRRTLGPITPAEAQELLTPVGVSQLILEVTTACNLRCRYCIYSGSYAHVRPRRVHGNVHMPWEVARKAIDLFFSFSRARRNATLGWYGGEPFLRFDLMRQTVGYARSLPWAHPDGLTFSVTTNGTLLTEDIIQYCVDQDVWLTFSLDGPASEHDKHRRTVTGEPTFARVFSAMQRYFELMVAKGSQPPDEYQRIQVTYTPETDLLACNDFFVGLGISPGRVSALESGHVDFTWEDSPTVEDLLTLQTRYYRTLTGAENHDVTFLRPMFDSGFVTLAKRDITPPIEGTLGTGACFPGSHRIYVSVDGRLHMCERVSQTMPLGDVWIGIDWLRLAALVNRFRHLMDTPRCCNCWLVRFCPTCYTALEGMGGELRPPPTEHCEFHKQHMEATMAAFCAILERNPAAFDYTANILLSGYELRS